eukprot:1161233-Pelagomonas_calceolata.AAC.4
MELANLCVRSGWGCGKHEEAGANKCVGSLYLSAGWKAAENLARMDCLSYLEGPLGSMILTTKVIGQWTLARTMYKMDYRGCIPSLPVIGTAQLYADHGQVDEIHGQRWMIWLTETCCGLGG